MCVFVVVVTEVCEVCDVTIQVPSCVLHVVVTDGAYVQQERRPRRLRKENLPPSGDANRSDFLSFSQE